MRDGTEAERAEWALLLWNVKLKGMQLHCPRQGWKTGRKTLVQNAGNFDKIFFKFLEKKIDVNLQRDDCIPSRFQTLVSGVEDRSGGEKGGRGARLHHRRRCGTGDQLVRHAGYEILSNRDGFALDQGSKSLARII